MTKQTVLIVDDRPDSVDAIADTLKGDCDVRFAGSGARALELATDGIDLILLAAVMPDVDGLEVCRRLKRDDRTSRIPIIFVAPREAAEDQEPAFEAGAVDFVTKPIVPAILRARVRTHLELKRLRDLIVEMELLDPLTGICNRRQFDESLDDEWKRAARSGRPLSLAMLDIDHFNRFNDTYGPARGDDCLRQVGQTVGDIARRVGDVAARYGPEEFALVLPGADAEAMQNLMRALLRNVASLLIEHASSDSAPYVTVSIGAVTTLPTIEGNPSVVVEAAERLLSEAKAGGRAGCVYADLRNDVEVRIQA